jgi:hypothetical protein
MVLMAQEKLTINIDEEIEKLMAQSAANEAELKEIEILSDGLGNILETLMEEQTRVMGNEEKESDEITILRMKRIKSILNEINKLLKDTQAVLIFQEQINLQYAALVKREQ